MQFMFATAIHLLHSHVNYTDMCNFNEITLKKLMAHSAKLTEKIASLDAENWAV